MNSQQTLEREFLPTRAKILEIAATLDRIQRGAGDVREESSMKLLQQGLEILQTSQSDRAEQVQLLFSRPYDEHWQEKRG